jgi:S-adenosylmethionine:tRNA ribosyltransferase-isomerase
VSAEALQQVRAAVGARRAIVPVGTTSVRTLESLYWWGVMLLARDEGVKDASEILVNQWDPYRMARQFGGWDGLPSVAEALDAVAEWAQARAAEGGGGAGRAGVVGRTHLLIVPGSRFAASIKALSQLKASIKAL